MTVAVENQDQEDEHSYFADNIRDVYINPKSINNIIKELMVLRFQELLY
jgi:putative iron-regulated protein